MQTKKAKSIVVYFSDLREGPDPFELYPSTRDSFYSLFQRGKESGLDMYVASGRKRYVGEGTFLNPLFYTGDRFVEQTKVVADAVYDRSIGLEFPPADIEQRVLNCITFKELCHDKGRMYDVLSEWMPHTQQFQTREQLEVILQALPATERFVIKPFDGYKGKGVCIDLPAVLRQYPIEQGKTYLLQEFVETADGVGELIQDRHDFRIIIVNGQIVQSYFRIPKEDSLFANLAQGGRLQEVELQDIPIAVKQIVQKVQERIDKRFSYPLYSIDFGVNKEKPFIFELNDVIGFPPAPLKPENSMRFIQGIIDSLKRLAA